MKYHVEVDGRKHVVELIETAGREEEPQVRFDGRPVEVTYREVDRHGQVALFLGAAEGDKCYAVSIEGDASHASVTVAGHLYRVDIEDEREHAAHAAERREGRRGGDVKAVMPGVVVDVLVREGDEVAAGQPLLILSAMKMQNEIPAPRAGRVERVFVAQGRAVASGERLVTLASPAEAAG